MSPSVGGLEWIGEEDGEKIYDSAELPERVRRPKQTHLQALEVSSG